MHFQSISVIIPVLNEERNLKPLIERLHNSFTANRIRYELIFIDDNSSDNSVNIINSFSSSHPVKVFSKISRKGKAFSLIEGFARAQYEAIGMIDADLQYPPEAIPLMLKKLNEEVGVVVASRIKHKTSRIRRIISYLFLHTLGKILHGFDLDVQSGLKVFKKEVIERITLSPGPWSFDLEFLVKVRNAGYKIDSVDIVFEKRLKEKPKISLLAASWEIGLSALRLKFKPPDIVPLHPKDSLIKGQGFHYKGVEFVHHSDLDVRDSAVKTLSSGQEIALLAFLVIVLLGITINWLASLKIFIFIMTSVYFSDLFFNLFLITRSFIKIPEIQISAKELKQESSRVWPKYTILCPLYREARVLPQFVRAIKRIDYPRTDLQVLLLLEEDDRETVSLAREHKLPSNFEMVVIPHSQPKTKPKALNYGLKKANGDYVVVYDAEDIPDPKQLKKTILAFEQADPEVVCMQAKLNFYNPHHNLLTKVFTAEYSLWFDLILPGLQSIFSPLPLGGTSNHFKKAELISLGGWDSFNVTEDCDLGMRLSRKGYRTAIVNSLTLEEASSGLSNWMNQRTRWIKGYIQTYLVHMRNPRSFLTNNLKTEFILFQLIIGLKILALFINPLMWATTILYFAFRPVLGPFIEQFYPAPVLYMGVFSLVFGNFLYLYYYMIGAAKRGHFAIIKYAYLVPIYWLGMSLSSWKAVVQLIHKPHFWPKTAHGFHLNKNLNRKTKILSSGSLLLAVMMISNFLNFVFNAYLGRAISFVDFGLVTLVNTFWYLLSVPVSSLGNAVVHRTAYIEAKYSSGEAMIFFRKTLKKTLKAFAMITGIWLILSPWLLNFFKETALLPFIAFAPVIMLAPAAGVIQGFLQGNFRFFAVGIIVFAAVSAKLLSAVFLVEASFGFLAYLSILVSVLVSFLTAVIIVFSRLRRNPPENFDIKSAKFSFPRKFFLASLLNGLSTTAFLTFDVLLAKHYLSAVEAGEYAFLSLIGKMVFFFGSILNVFLTSFVSRDLGAGRNPEKIFYRIFGGTMALTVLVHLAVSISGYYFLPLLFGDKALSVWPYIPFYSLAIAMYVVSNTIISYHLLRHHYSFPALALAMSLLLAFGIVLNHRSIGDITFVLLTASSVSLVFFSVLHLIQRNGKFFARNLADLAGLFLPLPGTAPVSSDGKRILIFNWRDTRHIWSGGAEVYIHELSKRWVELGHSVTLFCGNDSLSPQEEMIDGVQIIRRGGFYFVYFWAFLYYFLRFRGQFDTVIDSENGIPFFTPLFVSEKKYLLIHHVHQDVFRKSLKPPLSNFASFLEMTLMPFVYKNIQVITVSPSSKKEILERGLTVKEPIIIYNGVDLNFYRPGRKSKNPLVLYLGRLKYYKSLDIFVKAAGEVLKKLPQAEFVIAGGGEEKDGLKKLAVKLGIEEKIRFAGKVSEKEKLNLLQKAWVFVNPSFMEGWGITTIEANACGTPVVASDVPGLQDSVNNPHNGIQVPYGDVRQFADAIVKIIGDDKLRVKMQQESLLWAKQFDWSKSVAKSLEILNE